LLAGGATVSFAIHRSAPGGGNPDLPGGVVAGCSDSGITPTTDTDGSYVIRLPEACLLAAGAYWLVLQARQDVATHGQHFWSTRSIRTGSEAVWRNPGNGFGSGCAVFRPQTQCGVGGGASPDLLFQIVGETAGADLMVVIDAAPIPAIAGQTLRYQVDVSNLGPAPARDAELLLALATGVTSLSATTSPGGSCAVAADSVVCRWIGLTAEGATRVATIEAMIPAASTGGSGVLARATVSSLSNDTDDGNNVATSLTTVATVADLSLSMAGSPDPLLAGQVWTIAADIVNAGPSDAQGVRVAVALPPGVSVAHAEPGPGGTCSESSQFECVWPGSTAAASSRRLIAGIRVGPEVASGTQLIVLGVLASQTEDDEADNNSASARGVVQTAADLHVSLQANPSTLAVGSVSELRVQAGNFGPSDAQAVEVEIVLGADLRFARIDAPGAECQLPQIGSAGAVRCRWLGATAPQAVRELLVSASGGSDGHAEVVARTNSATSDVDPSNNRAVASVSIGSGALEIPTLGMTAKLLFCLLLAAVSVRRGRW
jgi:uncharacterized repeat protein (TIGR01451 family)